MYQTRDLPEASDGDSPDDSATVAGDMEDQGDCEDPEEVDEDVMSLLSALHQDTTLSIEKRDLTDFDLILQNAIKFILYLSENLFIYL